jgi:hypothetical protein
VQLAVLSSAGVFVAISVRQAFLPVALQDLGYPATTIGALISFGALAAVLVRPLMPLVSRAVGRPGAHAGRGDGGRGGRVGADRAGTSVVAFACWARWPASAPASACPLSIVTVASHVDPRHRGTALGLRLSLNRAAQLAMPVAIGAVIGAAGFGVGFGLAGALLAGLALAAAGGVAAFERQASAGLTRGGSRDGAPRPRARARGVRPCTMFRLTVMYNLPPGADEAEFLRWRLGEHQQNNASRPACCAPTSRWSSRPGRAAPPRATAS